MGVFGRFKAFGLDAALEGIGLAYMFEALALPHVRAKRLKRVLTAFSPIFPGFYLYYPNRQHQSTKLKALIDYVTRRARPDVLRPCCCTSVCFGSGVDVGTAPPSTRSSRANPGRA